MLIIKMDNSGQVRATGVMFTWTTVSRQIISVDDLDHV